MPAGRPTDYRPEYCQQILDFFGNHKLTIDSPSGRVCNEYPTLADFARKIKCCHYSLITWAEKHPEFAEALKKAKEHQHEIIIKSALMGLFNASFSIFAMKNIAGWRDHSSVELGGEIKITVVNYAK